MTMLRDMKLGVHLDPTDVAKLTTERGLVLDVEHAEVIELSTPPSALVESADAVERENERVATPDGDRPDECPECSSEKIGVTGYNEEGWVCVDCGEVIHP